MGGTPEHPSVVAIDTALRSVTGAVTGSLHVHCTDVEGEWYAEAPAGEPVLVVREHRKGDAVLRGPADDLAGSLRTGKLIGAAEALGDPVALTAWLAAVTG